LAKCCANHAFSYKIWSMPRLPEPIRARRGPRGYYIVNFAEDPGRSHTSPIANDADRTQAIAWARRNRERLLRGSEGALTLLPFLVNFFDREGDWARRMEDKGRHYTDENLTKRQRHLDSYIIPLFGRDDPRTLTGRYIDDILLATPRASGSGKPLASATKYKIVNSFSFVLEDLRERGIISTNPLAGVPAYSKTPVSPRTAFPRDHLPILFPASHGELA